MDEPEVFAYGTPKSWRTHRIVLWMCPLAWVALWVFGAFKSLGGMAALSYSLYMAGTMIFERLRLERFRFELYADRVEIVDPWGKRHVVMDHQIERVKRTANGGVLVTRGENFAIPAALPMKWELIQRLDEKMSNARSLYSAKIAAYTAGSP